MFSRKRRTWLLATTVSFLAVAALQAQQVAPPKRIVSTSPSITETLFALGLGDRVVGVSQYCRYPAAVSALPKVGSFLKPNVEVIARLTPDLVFVHSGPQSTASQLGTLGIKTALVDPGSLPSVFATIRQIGAAAGVPDRATQLVGDVTGALDRVKTAVAGKPNKKVLIIVGRRTGTLSDIVAVGPGSYLQDIAAIAGGENVLASASVQYPRISMETVIRLQPDVIIDIGEMGESPADSDRRRRQTESLWAKETLVAAVSAGGLHAINDDAFVVPGPRVVDAARAMASWFHAVTVR
jgi:iron complex transport system substrate-binding protein